jgi:hypothetical protein
MITRSFKLLSDITLENGASPAARMATRWTCVGSILYRIVGAIALLDYQQASSVIETAKSMRSYAAPKPYDFLLSLGTLEIMTNNLRDIFYLQMSEQVQWASLSPF